MGSGQRKSKEDSPASGDGGWCERLEKAKDDRVRWRSTEDRDDHGQTNQCVD